MNDRELLQQVLAALETAVAYVEADLNERMRVYAGYPHRYHTELDDRTEVDRAIVAVRDALAALIPPGCKPT